MSSTAASAGASRRNPQTANIDRLTTREMLEAIGREDGKVVEAVTACLPDIVRLVDNATATISRGGRVVLAGAGASGRAAVLAAGEFAPDNKHALMALIAGGALSMMQTVDGVAGDYDRGLKDLKAIAFSENDMLIGLSVSGKTPWLWGAMRYAWSLGARVALISEALDTEAAQLAEIAIQPQTGPEVVAGYNTPKAHLAQKHILNMLTTALAVRSGRVFGNLRVDVAASSTRWQERQIAIVMEAAGCGREEAKSALAACGNHCRTAILMLLSGLDAWRARELLSENGDSLRIALAEAIGRSTVAG
ncbi:N-acetylmuramic acid 6-phosphate etherase [Pluralibacter gergoviae]|uniref:N-acetylmuramic acid 6-phosphate etherase n=1 Tax=Pluralibacter gergoviae TaxID=61647 RepID=UPI0004F852FD|nr:N-acetylmuramic acid 6-phosphate etherase [Pluralibacter gergoviae]AIR02443.1 N-acetylmuramic acid 6-phosphate etherase [Pluralibacter gergoviae]